MISVSRCWDEEFIATCYQVPSTWNAITDDNGMHADLFFPNMDATNYWLEIKDEDEKLGVFLGRPTNAISLEVHTILLPNANGRAKDAAQGAIDWAWKNTSALRLTTIIPAYNKAAIRLARAVGMKVYGTDENSFLKSGCLHDQVLLGISKE